MRIDGALCRGLGSATNTDYTEGEPEEMNEQCSCEYPLCLQPKGGCRNGRNANSCSTTQNYTHSLIATEKSTLISFRITSDALPGFDLRFARQTQLSWRAGPSTYNRHSQNAHVRSFHVRVQRPPSPTSLYHRRDPSHLIIVVATQPGRVDTNKTTNHLVHSTRDESSLLCPSTIISLAVSCHSS